MTLAAKRKLNTYMGKKIADLFPNHSVKVQVRVNTLKEEININIRSATLSIIGIRRSRTLRKMVKRIAPICHNYFNLEVSTVCIKNTTKSPYPYYYDVATDSFISWFLRIETWERPLER